MSYEKVTERALDVPGSLGVKELDGLIDRALECGATYVVIENKGKRSLWLYDNIPRNHPSTEQISADLKIAAGASWPMCYDRIFERATSVGGVLNADAICRDAAQL